MPKFRATVRVSDLEGVDPAAAQQALDERLKGAGFENWQVVSVETAEAGERKDRRSVRPPVVRRRRQRTDGLGLFFVAAGAWVVWFFWLLLE